VRMANWFNQNRGVVTVCEVIVGELQQEHGIAEREAEMDQALAKEGLVAFGEVDVVADFETGLIDIAQANGFAGMQSNTVMFGWPNNREGLERMLRVARAVARIHKSTVIARLPGDEGPEQREQIDVWWRGMKSNGDMMLLLAHLLHLNAAWRAARITVRTIVNRDDERAEMAGRLQKLVTDARIEAATDVIIKPQELSVAETMHRASRKADVVFLGLKIPERGQEGAYAERLMAMAEGFHATIFVRNSGRFAGELIH